MSDLFNGAAHVSLEASGGSEQGWKKQSGADRIRTFALPGKLPQFLGTLSQSDLNVWGRAQHLPLAAACQSQGRVEIHIPL